MGALARNGGLQFGWEESIIDSLVFFSPAKYFNRRRKLTFRVRVHSGKTGAVSVGERVAVATVVVSVFDTVLVTVTVTVADTGT